MVHVDADAVKQLVTLRYVGAIGAEEMERVMPAISEALTAMKPGFTLLSDMSDLEAMDGACAPFIERVMDWCNEKEVGAVLRVIPDPKKDIGFTIMSRFHYRPSVKLLTFESLAGAKGSL